MQPSALPAPQLAPVVRLPTWSTAIERFVRRYPNDNTRRHHAWALTGLSQASAKSLQAITEDDLIAAATAGNNPSNNTVYQRSATYRVFFKWCQRQGLRPDNPGEHLREADSPISHYKKTYGKEQARYKGRWLTRAQADQLLAACDGTLPGLRDQLIIRLGLMGIRRSEIANLRIADTANLPRITWLGKGRKLRRVTVSPPLAQLITVWLAAYPHPGSDKPLLCAATHGRRQIIWGQPIDPQTVYTRVLRRARQAGLDHVATHDLRRPSVSRSNEAPISA